MLSDGFTAPRDDSRSRLVTVSVALTVVGLLVTGVIGGVVAGADSDARQAQASTPENLQQTADICGRSALPLVTSYNNRIAEVPWFVRAAVGGRVIHGVVHNDTIGNYTIETSSGGTVQSLAAGTPASASVRVITNCASFGRISAAGDPVDVFWAEYQDDRVRIIGLGFGNWLLIELLKNPLLAAGMSLMFLLLVGLSGYYYVRRRQMTQRGLLPVDEGNE